MQTLHIINAKTVNEIISLQFDKIYQLVCDAYMWHYQQKIAPSKSHFLNFKEKPEARIIALPSYINHNEINRAGLKWISSFPKNHEINLPRASAIIILNDLDTGYPVACLEGSFISAIRTACSAVLAADYLFLCDKHITSLGIIGTGFIAKNILNSFVKKKWRINQLVLFDQEKIRAEQFAKNIDQSLFSSVRICSSSEEVLQESKYILFSTTAAEPYIHCTDLLSDEHCLLNISLRDISPDIIYQADNYVDDIESVLTAKTSPHLALLKYGDSNFIHGVLGELVLGEKKPIKNKLKIFSPMGMGFLDLIVADFIYKQASITQKSLILTDFFI